MSRLVSEPQFSSMRFDGHGAELYPEARGAKTNLPEQDGDVSAAMRRKVQPV